MALNITVSPTKNAWTIDLELKEFPAKLRALPQAMNAIRKELLMDEFVDISYGTLMLYKPKELKNGFILQPDFKFLFSEISQDRLVDIFTKMAERLGIRPDNVIHFGMMAATAICSYGVSISEPNLYEELIEAGYKVDAITTVKSGSHELSINVGAVLTPGGEFQLTM